jgi:adenylate cyclase
VVDQVRGSADLVARIVELGTAGLNELARLSSNTLLAALLARLSMTDREDEPSAAEIITRGLLDGDGRYTRLEVAERAGISLDEARRLWRALGFPEVDDEQRVFTNADVAALTDAAALIAADIVDGDGLVELVRPLGNLMSRLAAAQTNFISEVLGARIAEGRTAEDPQLPDQLAAQALVTTRELLPTLERATVYAWRRHLAAEVGRALLPSGSGLDVPAESRPAAVGFIDLTGYTRLSRNVDLTELASVLDRFETVVLDTVVAHGGRVIKNLGDEILYVIDDPTAAAEATLELVEVFNADDALPPVHAGLAFGPVLERGGDVYGSRGQHCRATRQPRPQGRHPGRPDDGHRACRCQAVHLVRACPAPRARLSAASQLSPAASPQALTFLTASSARRRQTHTIRVSTPS